MRQPLHQQIGIATVDHVAFQCHPHMMIAATSFFVDQLGWVEHPNRRINDVLVEVRFFSPPDQSVVLQLTDTKSDDIVFDYAAHLALRVANPKAAAVMIADWALFAGGNCEFEEVDSGRCFVYLPSLLLFSLELVPLA